MMINEKIIIINTGKNVNYQAMCLLFLSLKSNIEIVIFTLMLIIVIKNKTSNRASELLSLLILFYDVTILALVIALTRQ